MSRFYVDCEFDGHGGPLLSMALVPEHETGLSAHITVTDAPTPSDPWVAANVIPILDSHDADLIWEVPANGVGDAIRHLLEHCECPIIIADSPVDIGRFCAAISTGEDGGWASTEYPLMTFEVHNVDCWPNDLRGAVQHNAWWDAMALRHTLAQGIEAASADETRSGSAEGESPVGEADAPNPSPNNPTSPEMTR